MQNAGLEGSVIVEKVKAEKVVTRGFDAESLEFVDMIPGSFVAKRSVTSLPPLGCRQTFLNLGVSVNPPPSDIRRGTVHHLLESRVALNFFQS